MKINGIAVSDIDRQSQYYSIHNLCLYYKNKALAEPRYIHGEFYTLHSSVRNRPCKHSSDNTKIVLHGQMYGAEGLSSS